MAQTRAVLNPYRETGPFPVPDRSPVQAFHAGLPGYRPTPLVRRTALAHSLGLADLYLKYEGDRFGLQAFKALGGSWALHCLLERAGGRLGTVATASEGNHGRSVAWAARLLGVPAVIFLPEHAAPERVANIRREGADIVLVAGNYEDAVHRCDEESRRRGWQIVSDVGYDGYLEIPPLVVEGYSTLFGEIDRQLAEAGWPAPDAVAIPGGVGGVLQAGVDHYRAREPGPRVIGVEPREADCLTESLLSPDGQPTASRGSGRTGMACLNCREVSLPSWPAIRRGVDALVGIEERYAEEAVRLLYQAPRAESLEVGTSGAASVGGLLALMTDPACAEARSALGLGADTVALAVCTEGAIDRPAFERLTRTAG